MNTTKIEWADCVWNPVTGCTPVSEGCENCYARRMAYRLRGRFGYPGDEQFRVTLHPERLLEPLKWQKPRRVFVCSMGDLFHENVPYDFLEQVFFTMEEADHHTFMILTKRPRRALGFLKWLADRWSDWDVGEVWTPPPNIWIGVTAENQARADERIPILLQIPAAVRFVSVEPMLGPVDLSQWLEARFCERHGQLCEEGLSWENGQLVCRYCKRPVERLRLLDWVIAGGETGPNARPMHPDWVRSLRDQCRAAKVPFFFKQWGEWVPYRKSESPVCDLRRLKDNETVMADPPGWISFARVGKGRAGRLLDGQTWDEYPKFETN
ncbi:MAG: phage Gp37/Gp68 family protein [Candidatus Jordarchaeaceae archaeon]